MNVRVSETAAQEAGTASRNATNAIAEETGAASKGCLSGTCFVAGTLVTMADGSLKPIEQIREGDRVLSKDEVSGKDEAKKVTHAFSKHATLVLSLHLSNGETLEATGDHPFYVQGKGWTPARECGIGTSIVTRAGPSVQVKSFDRHERDETVFNLTVEDDYSFFVGKAGAWTHNVDCPYSSAYSAKYDPAHPGGPDPNWSVDTSAFDPNVASAGMTGHGQIRDRTQFWQEWMRRNPQTLSASNQSRIAAMSTANPRLGWSPRVDSTWTSLFPEHADHMGEILIHHHFNHGPIAIPVPQGTHTGSGGIWHMPVP